MGAVYVEVDASMVNNGIMTLSESGGQTAGTYWIYWDANGYISQGWYGEQTPVMAWWRGVAGDMGYSTDEAGLSAAISAGDIQDLNDALGSWSNEEKWAFLKGNYNIMVNCTD